MTQVESLIQPRRATAPGGFVISSAQLPPSEPNHRIATQAISPLLLTSQEHYNQIEISINYSMNILVTTPIKTKFRNFIVKLFQKRSKNITWTFGLPTPPVVAALSSGQGLPSIQGGSSTQLRDLALQTPLQQQLSFPLRYTYLIIKRE